MDLLFLSALSAVGGLLAAAVAIEERRRSAPTLPSPVLHSPINAVLVPVRNEERNVVACVEALLNQTAGPKIRILDDGSTDRTAELAHARFDGEPQVEILVVEPLPAGWRGKVHALDFGWRGLDAPWILTTDADTRCAPELLARALAAAEDGGFAALSIAGRQEVRGSGENLLTPVAYAYLDFLLGDWRPVARGEGAPVVNGQFLLLRRDAWDTCGGFARVKSAPMDDVAIAAALQAEGFRTAFFRSPLLSVRMYLGGRETWAGWRRILGALFGGQTARLARLVVALGIPVALLAAAILRSDWPAAFLVWTGGAAASAIVRRGSGNAPVYGLIFPLDALALATVATLCAIDHRRGRLAPWKGRPMDLT
ncbi:MAG TPA: glycosyltransferase family 2 protein [Thermoanaerobaculia bacterium]|jgi:chlorobactene glucosyltransferase|nr:glycosyltransferase family 2 protein [Thermoanaerobaculia bacterium]